MYKQVDKQISRQVCKASSSSWPTSTARRYQSECNDPSTGVGVQVVMAES
jgi:hypothetical protein